MRNRPVYMCGLPVGGLQTNSPSRVPKFYLELMWGLMYHTCFLSSQAGLSVLLGIRYRPVCCETKSVIWYMSCSGARARASLLAATVLCNNTRSCDAVQHNAQDPPRGSRTPPSTGAPISPRRRGGGAPVSRAALSAAGLGPCAVNRAVKIVMKIGWCASFSPRGLQHPQRRPGHTTLGTQVGPLARAQGPH